MRPGLRARLEKSGNKFQVVGTELNFSISEMEQLLSEHAEQFSPNVVLRPLYQQHILPTLAYVGGPGELAYWLQLKKLHDKQGIFFPVLLPRCSYTILDDGVQKLMNKLPLEVEDYFKSTEELIRELQIKTSGLFELDSAM